MKHRLILLGIFIQSFYSFSQVADSAAVVYTEPEYVEETSNVVEDTYISTRIVNGHSVETLHKGTLEFIIGHKFGEVSGGANELFGLDNASDIRFGFEYGLTNNLMCGIGRSRGNLSAYKSVIDGFLKYRLMRQEKHKIPFSLSLLVAASYSYQKASQDFNSFTYYPKQIDRLAYAYQLNFARKFKNKLSVAVMPTIVYRNFVNANDVNLLPSIGTALTYFLNPKTSLSIEYYANLMNDDRRQPNPSNSKYHNSLAISVDWMTFGHNFKVFFANSICFGETQFIPFSTTSFNQGGYRLGFCIGRKYIKE
jgi:hypothetical protein